MSTAPATTSALATAHQADAYAQVDVFAERPLEGNALAIFTDARGLTPAEMQSLARETNLCESTFILPRDLPRPAARPRCLRRHAAERSHLRQHPLALRRRRRARAHGQRPRSGPAHSDRLDRHALLHRSAPIADADRVVCG